MTHAPTGPRPRSETTETRRLLRRKRVTDARRAAVRTTSGAERLRSDTPAVPGVPGPWTWYTRTGRATQRAASIAHRQRKGQEGAEAETWSEEVVRSGTGYRVRRDGDGANGGKRLFDVGYCDRKVYPRTHGVTATVAANGQALTLRATGPRARVRVMNAVVAREKLRPLNAYTGAGITRRSRKGAKKLKSTKRGKA